MNLQYPVVILTNGAIQCIVIETREPKLTFEKAVKATKDAERVQRRLHEYEPGALVQLNTAILERPGQHCPLPRAFAPLAKSGLVT
ncbi:hypothetical protein MTO96_029731 [Rhipicephalus appendiculatus]